MTILGIINSVDGTIKLIVLNAVVCVNFQAKLGLENRIEATVRAGILVHRKYVRTCV